MTEPDAKDVYLGEFPRREKKLDEGAPAWLAEARKAAIRRFAELGFPTLKHEEWKYTNVSAVAKTPFRSAGEAPELPRDVLDTFRLGHEAVELLFINGHLARTAGGLPDGARAGSLREILRQDPDLVADHLGKHAPWREHPFAALNTAFFPDGAFVHIPKGAIDRPIHLLFLSVPAPHPVVSYPRTVLLLGTGAKATVIESYSSLDGGVTLTNAVTEIVVGEDATLEHYKVQHEGDRAFHLATTQLVQGRGSTVRDHQTNTGAALARHDIRTRFLGEGGDLRMDGLFAVGGRQHVDYHTRVDHEVPACTSLELYKGILDGQARGIFCGNVIVHPGAQKTVARQTNRNLLLSEDALVDSIPGLEIRADDVKCAHGSTIGHLDEEAIFYLRTRGIEEWVARGILVYAFANEIVGAVRPRELQRRVRQLLHARLPSGAWIDDLP